MDKKELRKAIRAKKQALTGEEIRRRSASLTWQFQHTAQYRDAKTLYAYLPYNQEVRTEELILQALEDGKRVAVPKVYCDEMRFIYINDFEDLDEGYAGIFEPIADEPVADDPTALVLMPGVAFTEDGKRMGYGGGFYDRFLQSEPEHPTVALCYDFQIMEELPTEEFDVPVDLVIWA